MARLSGKIAIVTGAARGIGLACAKRFIAEGARVVLADIDELGAAEAKRLGDAACFVRCDVGEAKDAANLITKARKAFAGDIDVLVNNAGIVHGAEFLDLQESDFDRVLRVNLKGAFLVGQLAARKMVEQVKAGKKPGAIVNMASINSTVAIANQVPYSVSKGGLLQLTRTMALALAPYGIRVNAIGPGSIMTEILSAVATDAEAKTRILSRTPLSRIGEPEEVASVAAFLASDDASYITGEIIYVDGGRLALNYTVPVKGEALG
jgi:NAD(P)-dependent dehydrogenase (short-subunit alcohol dehydrogenase family)